MAANQDHYERKIVYARASLWAPFYAVGMVARIQGDIPIGLLEDVLRKLQTLHPPLASRVVLGEDGAAWLTTQGVGEFPLEVLPRTTGDDWVGLFLEQEQVPFAFDRGPVARFFLLRGDQSSDLVAIVPHVVCDGYSMAHVLFDAVSLLNDPGRVVRRPEPPPAVSWKTLPHSRRDNLHLRAGARVLNRVWPGSRAALHHDEYVELNRRYWARQQNRTLVFGLTSAQTSGLAARCKQQGVSVTGALVAAFLLAQSDVRPGADARRRQISVAVNIRDRLAQPPGAAVGVYASSLDVRLRSKPGTPFWGLAREAHARIHKGLGSSAQICRPLVLDELDPSIVDAFCAAVSSDQWNGKVALLSRFIKVRGEPRCLNLSNIGRVDLPELGAPYRLEALLPCPPLVPGGGMALNVLTVAGRMQFVVRYRQHEMDGVVAAQIRDRALEYLSGA